HLTHSLVVSCVRFRIAHPWFSDDLDQVDQVIFVGSILGQVQRSVGTGILGFANIAGRVQDDGYQDSAGQGCARVKISIDGKTTIGSGGKTLSGFKLPAL
ncbi:hypothetical protein NPIL_575771, partial [Nephila pilipes]